MLFSSQVFILLFLPLSLAMFYLMADSTQARLRWLTLSSLVFYGYWEVRFVPLLAASILGNWLLVRSIRREQSPLLVVACVALNLGLLGVFKYADFFASNLLALAGRAHQPWHLVLPLGISFFTFEQISYAVDRRHGRAPDYNLTEYAAYVAFFPHLLAGPIIRHDQLIYQFAADPRRPGWAQRSAQGLVLFVLGLCKKVFLADACGADANRLFDAAGAGTLLGLQDGWQAALSYSLQLYFDFSAYSDMAIGLGLLFGLALPLNFDKPYQARHIREFWRRWHMTLSSFLRDYVYIPLGGSRQSEAGVVRAAMLTMLLCGLWHGAGWTFVAWGALHGVAIVISRQWSQSGLHLPLPLAWLLTMLFVVAGWVLFRAANFGVAWRVLAGMSGQHGLGRAVSAEDLRLLACGALLAVVGPSNYELAQKSWLARPALALLTGLGFVAVTLRVGNGRSIEFIYFQF